MIIIKDIEKLNDYLIENLVEVDFIQDYWKYQQTYRELYYELKSMEILLKEELSLMIFPENTKDKTTYIEKHNEKTYEFIVRLKAEQKIFEDYDVLELLISSVDLSKNKNGYIDNSEFKKIKLNALIDRTIFAINRIELARELLIECYDYATGFHNANTKLIMKEYPDSKKKYLNNKKDIILDLRLNKSSDKDKITTYKFTLSKNCNLSEERQKIILESLEEQGYEMPYYYKRRDYSYEYNKIRTYYKKVNNLFHEITMNLEQYEHQEIEKKRNKNQYITNIILFVIAIINFLFQLITIYFEYLNPDS